MTATFGSGRCGLICAVAALAIWSTTWLTALIYKGTWPVPPWAWLLPWWFLAWVVLALLAMTLAAVASWQRRGRRKGSVLRATWLISAGVLFTQGAAIVRLSQPILES
ncbi:MAG: hypothetical protein KDE27_22985 [Planctomycetes bacterium]|nr:hypothetical protein [Planctomycetota bacterium]